MSDTKFYCDPDAFVYCFKAMDDKYKPFILNVRQEYKEYAISQSANCYGAFGESYIFWFDPSGFRLKSTQWTDDDLATYGRCPTDQQTLHGDNKSQYLKKNVEVEEFRIEM